MLSSEEKKLISQGKKPTQQVRPKLLLVSGGKEAIPVCCLLEQILRKCGKSVYPMGFFDAGRFGIEKQSRISRAAAGGYRYVLAQCADPVRFLKYAHGFSHELLLYASSPKLKQAPPEVCSRFRRVVLDYSYRRAELPEGPIQTYSIGDDRADYTAHNLCVRQDRVWFELLGAGVIGRVGTALRYGPEQALSAISAALSMGLEFRSVLSAAEELFHALAGLRVIFTQNRTCIYVSSQKTVQELEQSFALLRASTGGRLALACSAGRTRKRLLQMAERYADAVLLTGNSRRRSERTEWNAEFYLELQKKGIPCLFLEDSEDALKCAVANAVTYDIIFLVEESAFSAGQRDGGKQSAAAGLQPTRGAAL